MENQTNATVRNKLKERRKKFGRMCPDETSLFDTIEECVKNVLCPPPPLTWIRGFTKNIAKLKGANAVLSSKTLNKKNYRQPTSMWNEKNTPICPKIETFCTNEKVYFGVVTTPVYNNQLWMGSTPCAIQTNKFLSWIEWGTNELVVQNYGAPFVQETPVFRPQKYFCFLLTNYT